MSPAMDGSDLFAVLAVVAALIFQSWVTLRVMRSEAYEPSQKRAQARLIWMIPVFGALVSFVMLSENEEPRRNDESSERR